MREQSKFILEEDPGAFHIGTLCLKNEVVSCSPYAVGHDNCNFHKQLAMEIPFNVTWYNFKIVMPQASLSISSMFRVDTCQIWTPPHEFMFKLFKFKGFCHNLKLWGLVFQNLLGSGSTSCLQNTEFGTALSKGPLDRNPYKQHFQIF